MGLIQRLLGKSLWPVLHRRLNYLELDQNSPKNDLNHYESRKARGTDGCASTACVLGNLHQVVKPNSVLRYTAVKPA